LFRTSIFEFRICRVGLHGEYREIDRPERIVHTEFFGEGESLVTSSITAKGDTTTLTMTMPFPGSP
jgi:uncharacterized protein YndB with AHSA1/START domain